MKRIFKMLLGILMLFSLNSKVLADEYYSLKADTSLKSDTVKPGDTFMIDVGICDTSLGTTITHRDIYFYYDGSIIEACNTDDTSLNENDDNPNDTKWYCVEYREGWTWSLSGRYHNTKDTYLKAQLSAKSSSAYINPNTHCEDGTQSLIKFRFKIKDEVANQNTTITIVDDNNQKRTIDLNIYSKSSNGYLSSINLNNEDLELTPEFNKNKFDYEVYVPYDIEKINITATTEDNKANLSGIGEKQLEVGDNKISLVVVAENGSKKTYSVNVVRKDPNDDTTLSKVLVTDSNKKKISLVYNERTKTYTGDVSSEIIFVSFDIKCSGEDCFVDKLDSQSIQEGKNEFKFSVISQNGDKEEYKIVINKEIAKKDNSILYLSIGLGLSMFLCVTFLILYLKSKKN